MAMENKEYSKKEEAVTLTWLKNLKKILKSFQKNTLEEIMDKMSKDGQISLVTQCLLKMNYS